jgi:UDP-N-acetylglucosamine--N-acetylmuramyl-(pentapeptide) pyrophosphoryl-undecaprenol N-acetylglucosamine transferase
MRVYFAPCGMGLGHVGRIVPIARRLMAKKAEVTFSTYQEGIRYIENEKLPLIKAPALGVQVKPDGTIDFRRTAINPGPFIASFTILQQINAEIEFIENFRPDVVVSDSRASSLLAAGLLRIPRICILNQFQVRVPRRRHHLFLARIADSVTLTLIGKIWTSGNTVLIPDFPPPYTISIGNLNIPKSYMKNVKLIGPILEVHPRELQSEHDLRKKLGLPTDKPVIFVPISGAVKEKAFLTGALRKILLEFPEDYEIIMSLGYPNTDSTPERHGNKTIYKWIPNRFEYLKACDLIIARAGHGTITQAMCYGKPIILVPTPGHTEQLNNAKQAQDLGAAKILLQQELSKGKLRLTIQRIFGSDMPERLKVIQEEALKNDGLENAVNIIGEIARK